MNPIKEQLQISTFLVFYIFLSVQVGIGVLNFQPGIVKYAGFDAWISIIIAGIFIHVIVRLQYMMLNKNKQDIIEIHKETFGKWIGGFFSALLCTYFIFLGIIVIRSYIEVLQTWMFPELKTWAFCLAILPLIYYIISGGFRTVTGIAFMGAVLPAYLILPFLFPIKFSNFHALLPIFSHSLVNISLAAKEMTLSYLGFSVLLFFYPFIVDAKKSEKWAHLAIMMTTFVYLFIAIISFSYFSEEQLIRTLWATLGLWKIVEMPFVERFEYIGVASWLIVILPNACLMYWAVSRGFKRLFHIKQKTILIIIIVITFIVNILLKDTIIINRYSIIISNIGFYFIAAYIPFIFCIYFIRTKMRERK